MLKHPRILYFINGAVPTAKQQAEATRLGGRVAFRNARFFDGEKEACDALAGDVPAALKGTKPSAVEAMQAFQKSLDAKINETDTLHKNPANLPLPSNAPKAPTPPLPPVGNNGAPAPLIPPLPPQTLTNVTSNKQGN